MSDNNPGWQPDPSGQHDHRYWDGSQWTDDVSDAGVAGTDPYTPMADVGDATAVDTPASPEPPAPLDPTVVEPAPPAPDATAAWPTTPGAPAPPPPYVPTSPVSSDDGGSKKRLLVGGGILAAVVIAVIAFLALGGGDDEDVRAELASTFQREGGLSGNDADCVADFFVDELGEDAFDDVDFDADDPPPELEDAMAAIGARAIEECDIDESAFGGTTDTTEGTTDGDDEGLQSLFDDCADGDFPACDELYFQADIDSDFEEFGSTCGGIADEQNGFCEETNGGEDDSDLTTDGFTDSGDLPDDFEELLADTYEDSLGLDREKAECLAGTLAEAIEDGTLDQEQVMTDFLDYLEECDISLEEIGAN